MKKIICAFLLMQAILNAKAQLQQLRGITGSKVAAVSKLKTASLQWYGNFLTKKYGAPSSNGEHIFQVREGSNGRKVQLGTNLMAPTEKYTNNGAPRNQESSNSTCRVQPKKNNYLNPGEFMLPGTFDFNFCPGDFITPNVLLNNISNITSYNANGQRAAYKLGTTLFKQNGVNQITVNDFSTKPQAKINDSLKSKNYGSTIPTQGIIDITELKSDMDITTSMETSLGVFLPLEELGVPADVTLGFRGEMNGQTSARLKFFMVNFVQPMYNISVLTNPNALFVNPAAAANNASGAYISDVTYGRRAMFIFAAADYSYLMQQMFEGGESISITGGEAAGLEAGVKASGSLSLDVRNSVVKFWGMIQGGSGGSVLASYNDITTFHTEFKKFVASPTAATYSAQTREVPLSYSLRRISDGALIGTRSVGNFDEYTSCNTNTYDVEIDFKGFEVKKVVDGPFDNDDDIWGTIRYTGRNTNGQLYSNGSAILFNVPNSSSISRGSENNKIYSHPSNPRKIIENMGKADLLSTILNFSEDVADTQYPLPYNPAYNPLNPSDLQFKMSWYQNEINSLQPNASITKDYWINMYEGGDKDNAHLTLHFTVKVLKK
jgi:hypothetical protein